MPFTFHLGDTEAQAKRRIHELSYDYKTHQKIFENGESRFEDLNFVFRLNDYYQDTLFLDSDVTALKNELETAISRIHDGHIVEELRRIWMVCETAERESSHIYVFRG